MKLKFRTLNIQFFICVIFLTTLSSCNETIPKRTTISPSQIIPDEEITCDEGQIREVTVDEETGEEIITCTDPPPVRPTGAIIFKSDYCGCNNGKAVTYGNCSGFCSGQNTDSKEIFFANFTTTPDIALSGLGSVDGWCRNPLEGDKTNPKCVLEVKTDEGGTTSLEVTTLPGSNSIKVDMTNLPYDKTYVLTLVESISGAKSNSIQIVKYSPTIGIPVLGPLKNAPISQYTCLVRKFLLNNDTGENYYQEVSRMHFYFIPLMAPDPLPPDTPNLVCHDIFNPAFTESDNILYPRLELIPGALNLWDSLDPRFFDNNGSGARDIDEIIIQKTRNFGGNLSGGVTFFSEFKWPGQPTVGDDGNANPSTNQTLGFFMAPWIDQTTLKSYCLNSTHYNSDNPLYKALRDIIGVDTEGIYIAQAAQDGGANDLLLIRESVLKQIWFYLDNGVPTAPTEQNIANNRVYFYYPISYEYPYIKTSTQRAYIVRRSSELSNTGASTSSSGNTSSGGLTSYPPHDGKIGCIPKF